MIRVYFWIIRLAALFGHAKARKMAEGQKTIWEDCSRMNETDGWIWFHAASVGEFEQARPIIEKLKEKKPQCKILLTFFSPSGYEMRKNYDKADKVLYLPFATRGNVKRFLDCVRPQMALFVKYEFWPAYLKELRQRNIPTYLLSAIFRPNQLFFKPWGGEYRRLLHCFTRLYVQDEESRTLLARYGITDAEVVGDTRFDRVTAIAATAKDIPVVHEFICEHDNMLLHGASCPKVIVAGSTWPPDEALLAQYMEERPDVKVVLVPHEIDEEHLHQIFQLFKGRFVRFSEATNKSVASVRLLLVDTMGLLSSIYRYGQVGYIGGGFGVGIHNTLEPAVYGMPVIFGPNYHKFREAKGLIAAGAAQSVKNYHEFAAAMDNALERHESMGQCAKTYIQSELGATEKIYNEIFS